MTRVLLAICLLTACGPARLGPGDRQESPVRLLVKPGGRCSSVAIAPEYALTAGHCLGGGLTIEGRAVYGEQYGAQDLAILHGAFRPPYARLGRPAETFDAPMSVEGFGCRDTLDRRPARGARLIADWPEHPIEFTAVVCRGDSGGALWQGDLLIGVLSAIGLGQDKTAYATEAPSHLPASPRPWLPEADSAVE